MCVYSSYKDTSAPSPLSTLRNNFQFGDNLKWVLSVVYSALTISISDGRILLFAPLITQQFLIYDLTYIHCILHVQNFLYSPPPSSPHSHYPIMYVSKSIKSHSSSIKIVTFSLIYIDVEEIIAHILFRTRDFFQ